MFGKIKGEFREYDATFISNKPDFSDAEVEIKIFTNSLYTGNEKRDGDLKSEGLFDVYKYPEMNFHGNQIEFVKDNIFRISGILTIKDINRTVVLDAIHLRKSNAEDGQKIMEWQITAIVKRSDFGLKLGKFKELLAEDKVTIDIKAVFLLQSSDVPF